MRKVCFAFFGEERNGVIASKTGEMDLKKTYFSVVKMNDHRYNSSMKRYYFSGEFAKLANVTQRTLRYYDKIGLLKPSLIMENGYRKYSDDDLIQLQKIVFYKQLGFSLEEIFPMILNEDRHTLKESFETQIAFIDQRLAHLKGLKDSLRTGISLLEKQELNAERIAALIRQTTQEEKIISHYKDATNLNVRIHLHERYSISPVHWFDWLYQQIDFSKVNKLLELGCGNGKLWEHHKINVRNREFFLSDISEGMLAQAKQIAGDDFSYLVIDAKQIPFKNAYFDTVIANHMLFYVKDVQSCLHEITRVLGKQGILYCSTYGKAHMAELSELAKAFDERISLSDECLYERFGLENGHALLKEHFAQVQFVRYEDKLVVDQAQPLVDYILSCHGNQNEIIGNHVPQFKQFIETQIQEQGALTITKDAGLFICSHPLIKA